MTDRCTAAGQRLMLGVCREYGYDNGKYTANDGVGGRYKDRREAFNDGWWRMLFMTEWMFFVRVMFSLNRRALSNNVTRKGPLNFSLFSVSSVPSAGRVRGP